MSQEENARHTETGKILGSVYGSLIILLAVLLLLSSVFATLPTDAAFHAYTLACILSGFIVLMGSELARLMFKSGITVVGFIGFLTFNLLLVSMSIVVIADMVVPTIGD